MAFAAEAGSMTLGMIHAAEDPDCFSPKLDARLRWLLLAAALLLILPHDALLSFSLSRHTYGFAPDGQITWEELSAGVGGALGVLGGSENLTGLENGTLAALTAVLGEDAADYTQALTSWGSYVAPDSSANPASQSGSNPNIDMDDSSSGISSGDDWDVDIGGGIISGSEGSYVLRDEG